MEERPVSLGHKRTKPTEGGHSGAKHFASSNVVHISDDRNVIAGVEPPKRQYLTRSRVVAATNFGQQGRHDRVPKNFMVPACFLLALEVKICLLLLAVLVFLPPHCWMVVLLHCYLLFSVTEFCSRG
ncbi:hypothetical protein NC651_039954 [Populus alba x Populus x berolinensis]|nr:hypothetical protein NC651_039954 [Populus alba x Populus x berolinensis]